MLLGNTGMIELCDGTLTAFGGLIWHGITNQFRNILIIATENKELDGFSLHGATYVYVENIDRENFIEPCELNNDLLIPTMERSIVQYMMERNSSRV